MHDKMLTHVHRKKACARGASTASAVGIAVMTALYGLPCAAAGPPTQSTDISELGEIMVTATRRVEALEAVPYSISVVGGAQLSDAGVTDLSSLANQVPGLSVYNLGARFSSTTPPIIRGINATSEPRGFRSFEQDPVGTYIGNSPISGYYQLEDIKQVEVLRGPQGTLYGAGALGGALRLIPNSPELGNTSGEVQASASRLAHSSGTGYTASAVGNLPIGDTFAFRASGKYTYQPGFINAFGLLSRTSNDLIGVPLLANPSDPVNSSGIYHSQSDWNWQRTFTGRAALLWKPSDSFTAELAFLHADASGDGSPQVNFTFPGGAFPLDPRITAPAGGHYQEFSQIDQPWSRYTNLGSLDLSYDAGFATLSATTSYHTTSGSTLQDETYNGTGVDGGLFVPYYSGTPANPRFIWPFLWTDNSHSFSQEVRLVSKAAPDRPIDYVIGAYYERTERYGSWYVSNPGGPERAIAQGCGQTGVATPCLVAGPQDVDFYQIDHQSFRDTSVFGELTWHVMPGGQITFGVRHFSQQFTDAQIYSDYSFAIFLPPTPHDTPASKTVWKIDPSYEYAKNQYVYALWSQGFRRGGANSVPYSGFYQESPLLRFYAPDKTDNYEAGLKGRFANGVSYTVAVFDIHWDKPQISANLPSGNLAVYNGNTAESRGFEFESSGPLFVSGLTYAVSLAYADAHLSSAFSLPANNGAGTIVPGELTGTVGEQMPGSPKTSVAATLTYAFPVAPGYDMALSANGAYRTSVRYALAAPPESVGGYTSIPSSTSYETLNFSAALIHKPWRITAYVTNLLDRQDILAPPPQVNQVGNLTNDYIVNPPREVGVRVGYTF
jgi:outer membrane receptor protein involved in Fe transport